LRFGRRIHLSRSTERQNKCLIAVSPAPTFALWAISLPHHSSGGEALAVNANENMDQAALRKWIEAGLAIPEVRELHGDAGYLLNNMIAKYILASSFYAISESVVSQFNVRGLISRQLIRAELFTENKMARIYSSMSTRSPQVWFEMNF
jgi:hypothetical protein